LGNVFSEPQGGVQQVGECPTCAASIPSDPRFVPWCGQCGWNLQPREGGRPATLIETLYTRMGRTLSKRLYEEVRRHSGQRSSLTLSRFLAFAVAACVHLVTVACVVGGAFLIVTHWFHIAIVAVGGLLLGLGWLLRPSFARLPGNILPKERIPTWYQVADAVAQGVGVPPVHGIVLTAEFNASFAQLGFLHRKAILRLGVPLLTVLDTDARVALLGHELAHGVNRDPRRGFFIGSAVNTLGNWYGILRPARMFDRRLYGIEALGALLANVILLALSVVPWAGAFILIHLLWRDSQRAEYLADRLATRAAGTTAVLRLLDALHLHSTVDVTLRRLAVAHSKADFFLELREHVAALPERERERIRRVERLEDSRLDATHPPTAFRIDLITAGPVASAAVTLNVIDAQLLDNELATFQHAVQAKLIDQYQRSLYY
jgi:Zn-dependent protease with chaperone function